MAKRRAGRIGNPSYEKLEIRPTESWQSVLRKGRTLKSKLDKALVAFRSGFDRRQLGLIADNPTCVFDIA